MNLIHSVHTTKVLGILIQEITAMKLGEIMPVNLAKFA